MSGNMIWDFLISRYCHLCDELQACRVQATSILRPTFCFFSWEMMSLVPLNMFFLDLVTFHQFRGNRGPQDHIFSSIPGKSRIRPNIFSSPPLFAKDYKETIELWTRAAPLEHFISTSGDRCTAGAVNESPLFKMFSKAQADRVQQVVCDCKVLAPAASYSVAPYEEPHCRTGGWCRWWQKTNGDPTGDESHCAPGSVYITSKPEVILGAAGRRLQPSM
jgi:hypothetical protein